MKKVKITESDAKNYPNDADFGAFCRMKLFKQKKCSHLKLGADAVDVLRAVAMFNDENKKTQIKIKW